MKKNAAKATDIQNFVCNFAADFGQIWPFSVSIHIKSNFIN